MQLLIYFIICAIAICEGFSKSRYADYLRARSKLMITEQAKSIGGNLTLEINENVANNALMDMKYDELDECIFNSQYFNFSNHYFKFKKVIDNSTLYSYIRRMPKGAVLHVHDMGLLGPDYLLGITYKPFLYICYSKEEVKFRFADSVPIKIPCSTQWKLTKEVRNKIGAKIFDAELRRHFSFVVDKPDAVYKNTDSVWKKHDKIIATIEPLLTFRPIWERYFIDAMGYFMLDGVSYIELRTTLSKLYDLDGTEHKQIITARIYQRAVRTFLQMHPRFMGVRLIVASPRMTNVNNLREYLNTAYQIKYEMPDFLAGFDLIGQEDMGKSLFDFVAILIDMDLPFYFHAGETNWYGATDENIIDAVLLGARRIGHGFALLKHPVIIQKIIENTIALEVSVISNQVMRHIRDMRNHPLAFFIANGLPVVLTSDNPGLWEAPPISHDFYITWMGISSRRTDIRLFKQLAINSITYSSMRPEEKDRAMTIFNEDWDRYLNSFRETYYISDFQ